MSVERHRLHEEDVGAYLLGALPEVEARRFEAHVEECPVCRDEVERLRPVVEMLPRSVSPVAPPPSLKASLMEVVEAEARQREQPAKRRSLAAGLRARLIRPGSGLAGLRPGVAWVAAAAVRALGVVTGAAGLSALSESRDEDRASRTVVADVDRTRLPSGSGSLVLAADRDGAVLRVHGLPPLESDAVYQVWLKRGDEVISQSLFTVGEDGDGAGAVADDLEGADAVMVTREAAGGARAPTEKPVLTVAL